MFLLLLCACSSTPPPRTVTILHFSDYHSHAVPFYVDGERDSAGISRAFAYLAPLAGRNEVLVFNGGDTMNLGAPPWSDRFHCVEWTWWNGIVDAMAFGNHDADYGPGVFDDCRARIDYPILGANVVGPGGERLFAPDGEPYVVFERSGLRIGVFALAGSDFESLVRGANVPVEGVSFLDREETAREIVDMLRKDENVNAVVLIGHASTEDDEKLARRVPGIDLILGTHSHRLEPLRTIEGTATRMISPGQYLTHVNRVELRFAGTELMDVDGALVPMTPDLPGDPQISALVSSLQSTLEHDVRYAPLFRAIGFLDGELGNENVNLEATPLGTFVMDLVRSAAGADVALSTSSSFRGSLPPGEIRETDLREVLPYDNRVARMTMNGRDLERLLERVASLRGTDSFAQISGTDLEDQGPRLVDGKPIDLDQIYVVATTDYLASIATKYRDIFETRDIETTDLRVRDLVRKAIARN